ncbi:hypothetical protein MyNCGM70_09780 [Achromobacter xylosoxidans]
MDMPKARLNARKKIGLFLLALVLLYWIAVPVLPFLEIPHKAATISILVVGGEILFILAVAVLGKEYWGAIKQWCRRFVARKP